MPVALRRASVPTTASSTVTAANRQPRPVILCAAEDPDAPVSRKPLAVLGKTFERVCGFVDRRYFLVGVVAAVGLAAIFPEFGRKGGILRPELTVAWGATVRAQHCPNARLPLTTLSLVTARSSHSARIHPDRLQCGIFLLAGLSLPTNQLAAAALQWKEHALIQSFNLGFMPLAMLGVCGLLGPTGLFERSLLDGMLVMSALPTTVNMCVALTRSSDGNEALSIFNAVLGNVLGVVLTPALLLLLVGRTGAISIVVRPALLSASHARPFAPFAPVASAPPRRCTPSQAHLPLRRLRAESCPRSHSLNLPSTLSISRVMTRPSPQATLQKLCTKVLVPLLIGQLLRRSFGPALAKAPGSKKLISRTSESLLLLTVYSTFCDTFLRGFGDGHCRYDRYCDRFLRGFGDGYCRYGRYCDTFLRGFGERRPTLPRSDRPQQHPYRGWPRQPETPRKATSCQPTRSL